MATRSSIFAASLGNLSSSQFGFRPFSTRRKLQIRSQPSTCLLTEAEACNPPSTTFLVVFCHHLREGLIPGLPHWHRSLSVRSVTSSVHLTTVHLTLGVSVPCQPQSCCGCSIFSPFPSSKLFHPSHNQHQPQFRHVAYLPSCIGTHPSESLRRFHAFSKSSLMLHWTHGLRVVFLS